MNELLRHPWVRVLLIATTVAMCSWALRETAFITLPVVRALGEVLVPVAIAFCIAYVLTPIVDVLHNRWRLPRTIAAGVPFLLFLTTVVLGTILVVPTVLRQSYSLAERVFKAEVYQDLNLNHRWDPGEPFTDSNGNGRYDDQSMFDKAMSSLRDYQKRLRGTSTPALDLALLVRLEPVVAAAARDAATLDDLLAAARARRDPGTWPATTGGPAGNRDAWDAAWPGSDALEVATLAAQLGDGTRSRWLQAVCFQGNALAGRYALLTVLVRSQRDGQPVTPETLRAALSTVRASLPADTDDEGLATAIRQTQVLAARPAETPTPEVLAQAKAFAARLAEQDRKGQESAHLLLGELCGGNEPQGLARWLAPALESIETSTKDMVQALPQRLGEWAKSSMGGVDWMLELSLNLVLIPIYAYFLILAMAAIRRGVNENLPLWQRDKVLRIIADIEKVVAAFFRGRLLVCLICAVITWIGFIAIGWFGAPVPYALLFALLIGLATAVPLAGLLFLLPAVLLNLLEGGSGATAGAMIGVYVLVQGLESVVLTPGIMGREVELHPMTLIVVMLLCGKLVGVLGVILAVPIAASARILAREFLWPRVHRWAGKVDGGEKGC